MKKSWLDSVGKLSEWCGILCILRWQKQGHISYKARQPRPKIAKFVCTTFFLHFIVHTVYKWGFQKMCSKYKFSGYTSCFDKVSKLYNICNFKNNDYNMVFCL